MDHCSGQPWERQKACPAPDDGIGGGVAEEPSGGLEAPLFQPGDFLEHMHKQYDPVGAREPGKGPPPPRSFPCKHLNIMDPLLPTNNLGRSVNQASAKRIRLALRNGASTLEGILTKVDLTKSSPLPSLLSQRTLSLPSQGLRSSVGMNGEGGGAHDVCLNLRCLARCHLLSKGVIPSSTRITCA